MNDEAIIKEIMRGNAQVFERVYMEYFSRLCRLSYKIVGNMDIAEDIVQNIFFTIWETRAKLRVESNLGGYLARSVYNLSLQHIRSKIVHEKHHSKIFDLRSKDPEYIEYQIDMAGDSERVDKLRKAIDTLPEQCREILKMSRFEEKKNSEIAEKMGISTRTVENQLYIALKKLKDMSRMMVLWLISFL